MNQNDLRSRYSAMTDDELLNLHSQGTLTAAAYDVMEAELNSRSVEVPPRPQQDEPAGPYSPASLVNHLRGCTFAYFLLAAFLLAVGYESPLVVAIAVVIAAATAYWTKNIIVASVFPVAFAAYLYFYFTTGPGLAGVDIAWILMNLTILFVVAIHLSTLIRLRRLEQEA